MGTVDALVFIVVLIWALFHSLILVSALFLILPLFLLRAGGFRLAPALVLLSTWLTRGGLILRVFAFVVSRTLIVPPGLVSIVLLLRLGFVAVLREDGGRNHKEKKQNRRTADPDDFHRASNIVIVLTRVSGMRRNEEGSLFLA
jgi:hypothetical protein